MDASRFDAIVVSLSRHGSSRRRLLRGLAATAAGGLLTRLGATRAAADPRPNPCQRPGDCDLVPCGHMGAACETGADCCGRLVCRDAEVGGICGGQIDCQGRCAPPSRFRTCPRGQALCHLRCVDLQTDPEHCGGCGLRCQEGQRCVGGKCCWQCASGELCCAASSWFEAGGTVSCGENGGCITCTPPGPGGSACA